VCLVHVVNKTPWISSDIDPSVMQRLIDDLRGTGESLIHEATAGLRHEGIDVDSRLIEAVGADAGEIVVKEAASWPAASFAPISVLIARRRTRRCKGRLA
jgi:hypothetical protein